MQSHWPQALHFGRLLLGLARVVEKCSMVHESCVDGSLKNSEPVAMWFSMLFTIREFPNIGDPNIVSQIV